MYTTGDTGPLTLPDEDRLPAVYANRGVGRRDAVATRREVAVREPEAPRQAPSQSTASYGGAPAQTTWTDGRYLVRGQMGPGWYQMTGSWTWWSRMDRSGRNLDSNSSSGPQVFEVLPSDFLVEICVQGGGVCYRIDV